MTDSTEVSGATSSDGSLSELARLKRENELLRTKLTEQSGSESSTEGHWRRPWMSITCAVIAAILLPIAVLTVWARDTMLDTDQYVATVGPLVEDENIQEAVSFRVT